MRRKACWLPIRHCSRFPVAQGPSQFGDFQARNDGACFQRREPRQNPSTRLAKALLSVLSAVSREPSRPTHCSSHPPVRHADVHQMLTYSKFMDDELCQLFASPQIARNQLAQC